MRRGNVDNRLWGYGKRHSQHMEKHIKRRPAIVKPDEEFDYYEIDGEGLQEDTDHE